MGHQQDTLPRCGATNMHESERRVTGIGYARVGVAVSGSVAVAVGGSPWLSVAGSLWLSVAQWLSLPVYPWLTTHQFAGTNVICPAAAILPHSWRRKELPAQNSSNSVGFLLASPSCLASQLGLWLHSVFQPRLLRLLFRHRAAKPSFPPSFPPLPAAFSASSALSAFSLPLSFRSPCLPPTDNDKSRN